MRAGGAERVFANLLSLWDLSRDELHLVLLRREGPLLDQIPHGVAVHELGGGRFWRAIPRLGRLLRKLAPDALLSTQAHVNAAAGLFRRWWNVRRVVGRETNMPLQTGARGSPLRRWLYGLGYRQLDAVVCLTKAMAEEVGQVYGADSVIIPNPLRIEEIRAGGRVESPLEPGFRWLSAVGRFSEQKGFDLLLRALPQLPPDIRLCIVGDGRLRAPLEALAASEGVADRVVFAGYQSNPHRFVAGSELFVLSSRYEGQPNAALEALSLGVPVVAFDGPWGAREVVTEGFNGVIAGTLNAESLALAIRQALETRWDRERIRASVEGRFDGPTVAARYRELLK